MNSSDSLSPTEICERTLLERKQTNIERSILRSHNVVIERMLVRGLELRDAYAELHKKLYLHPRALGSFFGLLLDAAAFWAPTKISQARAARSELERVNQLISKLGEELAVLLERRDELHNISGFRSNTHYHIGDVIKAGASGNHHFEFYLQEHLEGLQYQYDLKYWPSLAECVDAIAEDADCAELEASDPLTAAATKASRASLADFFKALFVAIDENNQSNHGWIPDDFRLTDNTLASLTNCALDLEDDDMIEGTYVKRLRQRERKMAT